MTIFHQTRLELAAEPSQRQRWSLLLKSFAQRIEEGNADALKADLRAEHEAWLNTVLGEPYEAPVQAPEPEVVEKPAELVETKPRRFLR